MSREESMDQLTLLFKTFHLAYLAHCRVLHSVVIPNMLLSCDATAFICYLLVPQTHPSLLPMSKKQTGWHLYGMKRCVSSIEHSNREN